MMLKAIIFDMDGVIVDTEYCDVTIQKNFLQTLVTSPDMISEDAHLSLVGRSYDDLAQAIKDITKTSLKLSEISEQLSVYAGKAHEALDYQALFRKDMLKILSLAKANQIKVAVASSSPRSHIMKILDTCGIADAFHVILSGEDFPESKPHPAIYQAVLDALSIVPEEAIAIEDSYYGILAARRAGLDVIAYREDRLKVDQSQATVVKDDMNAIYDYLRTTFQIDN